MAALLAVYFCWGGTYLAIRFAVETLPPFLMAGMRFVLAGGFMYALSRWRGTPAPTGGDWLRAAGVGILLLAGGNGGVVWASRMVPSSLTALLVATAPLWMVTLNWLWLKDVRPSPTIWAGVALGLVGIGLLAGGENVILGASPVSPFWASVLVGASFLWGLGSIASRKLSMPSSAVMSTGMQMLGGGAVLLLIGAVTGEVGQAAVATVSPRSLLAFGYLVVFGSLVGFSAYVWLLQNAPPVLTSTYAYVNPVVAMLLGVVLGGEALNGRTVLSAAVIVVSVILLTASQVWRKRAGKSGAQGGGKVLPGRA
ncbi:EamA family transporter [Anaeroselena agilis]|uniref:EamA family transporter n=1 Tax=Anaeroselena agilis TaxID=3063788 RepID=A0ABU3NVD6_9FIRM|nr:EamA family transporter [Selenomonadales bacterium 4137-cl]